VAPPTAAATTTSIATVTANSAHTNPTPTVETRGPLPTAAPPQAMAPAPAVSAPAPVVSAPPPAVSAPAPAIAAPATGKTVAARPAATAPPPARPAQPAAIDVPPVLPKVAQAPMEKTVAPPPAPPISPRDAARTLEDQHLPVFAELPPDVQTRLGPLSLSAHFYSPNHERSLVNINGQSLHEGDPLNADLKVDRITPSGVILEYQGRRFQLAAQNWSR
jgi:hypothetical protein